MTGISSGEILAKLRVMALSLALPAGIASAAFAQSPDDALPAGSFIISRDITNRPAEGPGYPEEPNFVVLGGKDEILAALPNGMKPLSDAENAAATAGLAPQQGLVADELHSALNGDAFPRSASAASLAHEQGGGSVGGMVRGAIGALPAALGAMRGALGSGQ